jgi:hypothetical protein
LSETGRLRTRTEFVDVRGATSQKISGTKSYNNVAEEYKNEENAKERQKNTPETPTERIENTGLSE